MLRPLKQLKDYVFNRLLGATGAYTLRGRTVNQEAINEDLERVITGYKSQMVNVSKQLQAGTISLADWQTAMRDNIRPLHSIESAIAKGGWKQMSPNDWLKTGREFHKKQYAFLQNMAIDIEQGKQPLDGNFLRRAGMYADAGRGTGEEWKRSVAMERGYTQERRNRHVADSCPTCVAQESLGWQPIGTLNQIGDSECLTNCKCQFEYRIPEPLQPEEFTPGYREAQEQLRAVEENGEFYPGELQDARDVISLEREISITAKERGYTPSQMTANDWERLADELKTEAGQALKGSTQTGRETLGARAVGRRRLREGEREIIQVGGQDIERTWTGGSQSAARQATARVNRETKQSADEYMTGQLLKFGYDQKTVDEIGYTAKRRLLAEIGHGQPQSGQITGVSAKDRRLIIERSTPRQQADALEIAYNPRAARGLKLWEQYETSMVKAGKQDLIEFPPDNRETFIPDFVKFASGRKPKQAFEF